MSPRKIVFAGGGTGGHVMPALAVAEELAANSQSPIQFLVAKRGVEAELVRKAGYEVVPLTGRGIKRSLRISSIVWNVRAVIELVIACCAVLWLFVRNRPAVAVVVGGYIGGSVTIASVLLRIPIVVIQVDSHLGMANHFASRFARVVTVPNDSDAGGKAIVTGVPIRKTILETKRDSDAHKQAKIKLHVKPQQVLVVAMSGSLGSVRINEAVSGLARLWSEKKDVAIIHIAGLRNQEPKSNLLGESLEGSYQQFSYVDDISTLYAAADLMISRAGANSVAEIAALCIPAIFIPLPTAPGDHQRKNVEPLVAKGAALMISDSECSAEKLAELLDPLVTSKVEREKMTNSLQSHDSKSAAEKVAELIGSIGNK